MWRWVIAAVLLLLVTISSSAFQTNSNGFLADEIPLEVSTIMPSRILRDEVVRVYGEQALTVRLVDLSLLVNPVLYARSCSADRSLLWGQISASKSFLPSW